jgi:nucleotide-binding universal stress UspA family protein
MKILVAHDGSEGAHHTLDWAIRLANDEPGSKVSVLSVAPTLEATAPIPDAVDPSSSIDKHREQLAEAAAKLAAAGVQAETILKVGNPAEQILTAGEDGEYDMILVGRHGVHRTMRFLLGSVSDRVVRHATRPVMVVR